MWFQFGDFMLDAERYELRRCGKPVALEPRVLELLVHLIRHRDRVVTKDELLEEVWEGCFVTESVLTRAAWGAVDASCRLARSLYSKEIGFHCPTAS